jgi:hypothetical protein
MTAKLHDNIAICPNGHFGVLLDGTVEAVQGALNLKNAGPASIQIISRLQTISRRLAAGEQSAQSAVDDIAELLPEGPAAAIKQLGAVHPWLAIIIYAMILVPAAVSGIATAYRALVPSNPGPQTVITNNVTIINEAAPRNSSSETITKPLKREQSRRMKQMKRQQEQLSRKRETRAEHKGGKRSKRHPARLPRPRPEPDESGES